MRVSSEFSERGGGRFVWGDEEDAVVREVAGWDSFVETRRATWVTGGFRGRLLVGLLGALWNSHVLSGEWEPGDLVVGVYRVHMVVEKLPIADEVLGRFVLGCGSGYNAAYLLRVANRRPFIVPDVVLSAAVLADTGEWD